MRYVILFVALLALVGCEEEQPLPHPNQQAVYRAEKTADQALKKAEDAEHQLQHERRLRDIDKMKYQGEIKETQSEVVIWRLLLTGLSVLLIILFLWLAREVRTRRILAHVLRASTDGEEVKRE